jgi:mono/diheme cytochrome c family protein/glucose/arabinose dehydrogenase
MLLSRFIAVALLMVALVVTGHGYQDSPSNRPWPPEVQKVPPESPPLPPDQALKTFYMPPGYRLELVASEPLIQEPVAIDWDTEGRLWAVEMPGFMANIMGSNEHDPIGRVVVLEDTDDDGRMDKRTVFADGLVLARSLRILDRGVLVAEPPNAWLMRDTDGDLRMDTKELVTNQYGRREGDPQNNANGFHWALDNRMYTAGQADIQLRLKNGVFEVQKTLQRGEWGVTQDDAGRIYRNTNESALHVDFVPTAYYARNPNLLRTRGSYERLADDNVELNVVWPVRPNPGTNRAYQAGIDRADGSLEKFTSVCAPLLYRGDRLPPDVYGNVFVAEPAANLVSRLVLSDDGTTLRARKAYERGEFLASTDERFRPVYLSNAPDGTLYIVDMYRGIIEHRLSLTVYLRDHILARKLEQPTGFGRIYRVVHETTRRDTSHGLSKATAAQLVETLSHPNGWRRDTAQRLLVERLSSSPAADRTVFPALTNLALSAPDSRTRLHALWTLDGIDAIEPATVIKALDDGSRDVRASAIRIAERWLSESNHPIQAAVLKRLEDSDWAVRHQLAASIGTLPPGARETAAVALLERHAGDPIAVDAVLSGLRGSEGAVLESLMEGGEVRLTASVKAKVRLKPDTTEKPDATEKVRPEKVRLKPDTTGVITMLAATIVRSAQDAPIQTLFGWIAEGSRPGWQRAALLRGAEVALLGAAMPGTPTGRRGGAPSAALPCPTCPGGRAGPGGAYAYSKPEDFVVASGRAGRGGARSSLRLSREPAPMSALAARADDLGRRAASVLARVTWPGKPGEAAPLPALTVDQQRRYDAGREVYKNVCQACHQPDGRGQDKVAPSLIDSPLALAAAEIPARILLNGKEGSIGLMPPIGSTLDDEQLASVLTYIRREWGQPGTPVDPATVTAVRKLTAGRTRPWTDAELMTLGAAKAR